MDSTSATSVWSELSTRLGLGETSLSFLVGGGAGLAVVLSIMFVARFLYLCRPSEILIFSGRQHRLADGSEVGSRVVFGGRAWRRPLIENVQRMQMLSMPIDVQVQGAYTKVGIPLRCAPSPSSSCRRIPSVVMNAVERFLGRGLGDIQQVAKETLEGNLRGVLATLTPEEVERGLPEVRRLVGGGGRAGSLQAGVAPRRAQDPARHRRRELPRPRLGASGSPRSFATPRSPNRTRATRRPRRRPVPRCAPRWRRPTPTAPSFRSATSCAPSPPSYGQTKSAEARAEQAGLAAQATAEQALQAVRRDLEALRLQAEVVVPSEAKREASALDAAGQAAPIAENGRASAESLRFVADAWKAAGPSAPDMFLINKLEEITRIVVDSVGQIEARPGPARRRRRRPDLPPVRGRLPAGGGHRPAGARRDHRRRRHGAAHPGRRGRRDRGGPSDRRCSVNLLIALVVIAVVFGLVLSVVLTRFLYICQPNQVLVFSGGQRASAGRKVGYRIIKGGRAVRGAAAGDGRLHGSDQHADRGRRAGRLLERRHSGQRSRHRQRQDRGRAAGPRQRHRALPGRRPRSDHGHRQGHAGGKPARRAGDADARGAEPGQDQVRPVAAGRGRGGSCGASASSSTRWRSRTSPTT